MNEEIETTDEIIDGEFTDPTGYVAELEQIKSFKEMADSRGDKPDEEVREGGGEAEGDVEPDDAESAEEVVTEPEVTPPFLVLGDGTELTKDEAVAGYMRHKHYTQERMKDAAKAKEVEQYSGLIDAIRGSEELYSIVANHIRTGGQPAQASAVQGLKVPENYKGDAFVEETVNAVNVLTQRLDTIEGARGTDKQEAEVAKQRSANQTIFEGRLRGALDKLEGQLGVKLSPDDFVNKMNAHFEGKGLTPEQYMPMIIGPDSTYFSANVSEAYRDDIGKIVKEKVSSERGKRQPKGADKRALKATGKPPKPASQKVPRLPDGSLDMSKFMSENPVWDKDKRG